MQHIEHAPTEMQAARAITARVVAFIVSRWSRYQYRRRCRATDRILRGLSEHTLKDIGISRSDILTVSYGDGTDQWHNKTPQRRRDSSILII